MRSDIVRTEIIEEKKGFNYFYELERNGSVNEEPKGFGERWK